LENDSCIEEPKVDRWHHVSEVPARTQEDLDRRLSILSLSGGVMTDRTRTANRIDGLLTRMMESPSSARYLADIDKNLDYLFTSLQLDMIDLVAADVTARERRCAERGIRGIRPPDSTL
jgi:hypothetical protein